MNVKILLFFLMVGTIWYQLLWKFSIFNFQGRKGQKGHYSSQKHQIALWRLRVCKIALLDMICHYYITQKANLDPQVAHKSFKGQKLTLKVKKIRKWLKKPWVVINLIINFLLWSNIKLFLEIFNLLDGLLAFKRLMCNLRVQIDLLGNIIMAYNVQKSNFGLSEAQECNLVFLATVAAFLAFTTLKLQKTEFP